MGRKHRSGCCQTRFTGLCPGEEDCCNPCQEVCDVVRGPRGEQGRRGRVAEVGFSAVFAPPGGTLVINGTTASTGGALRFLTNAAVVTGPPQTGGLGAGANPVYSVSTTWPGRYNTSNFLNTGTGVATIPSGYSGRYHFNFSITGTLSAAPANDSTNIFLQLIGGPDTGIVSLAEVPFVRTAAGNTTAINVVASGTVDLYLAEATQLRLRIRNTAAPALTLTSLGTAASPAVAQNLWSAFLISN